MKRLKTPSGEVAASEARSEDSDDSIVRSAILVHSGPDGSAIEFQSSDGPIAFDADRIKNVVEKHNAMIEGLAAQYGGLEKMPLGAFPPILDQHFDDSTFRVCGRLNSLLKFEVRDVPGGGKQCACAVTEITFLGKDVVERVKDGRVYHLSIGIDEETDTLSETSMVITPAAPGAMLLKKGAKKTTSKIKGEKKMSARQKASAARMATIKKMQQTVAKLGRSLEVTKETARLAKRKGEVDGKIARLMREKKITPAELKGLDVKRLASMPDEAIAMVMKSFEVREPVIRTGQRGSNEAVDFASMGKSLEKRQQKRLRSETLKDLARLSGKKFRLEEDDEKHMGFEEAAEKHKDENELGAKEEPEGKELSGASKHMAEMDKCMAEGDVEGMKKCWAKMKGEGGEEAELEEADGDEAEMSADPEEASKMQSQVDELSTQMARMAGMLSELMSAEKEEGHDLSEGAEGEETEGAEGKKLAEEIEEDKAKV